MIASAMVGAGVILFGLSHTLSLSLVLMVCLGFGLIQFAAVCNTIVQSLVTEDKRARGISYYTTTLFRLRAVRQPAGRHAGASNRSTQHCQPDQRIVRSRLAMVHV
jgi:hypothetical protein